MIAQDLGSTEGFEKERNTGLYSRLSKSLCGAKGQARARHPGEWCGLEREEQDA